jgi:amidohydrolase
MLFKARQIQPQLVQWRREFHRYPELGFREKRTAARVAEILTGLGCQVRTGVGKTGVIGDLGPLDGSAEGRLVAIRSELDALPIVEANEVSYASETVGQMHACGHDSHMAMVLGAASLLAQGKLPGRVRFLFQPSEEVNDSEGVSGAPRMIADGGLEGVSMIIALHVEPATPVGQIRIAEGPFSGGVDSFFATIYGKGGHGAWPHETNDPILIAAHVILALNGIVSRRLDPFMPAVVSLGSIHAGRFENVIPDRVEISGTIRFMEPDIQKQIHGELERALKIANALGGDAELNIVAGNPPMINERQTTRLIQAVTAWRALDGLPGNGK